MLLSAKRLVTADIGRLDTHASCCIPLLSWGGGACWLSVSYDASNLHFKPGCVRIFAFRVNIHFVRRFANRRDSLYTLRRCRNFLMLSSNLFPSVLRQPTLVTRQLSPICGIFCHFRNFPITHFCLFLPTTLFL